MADVFTQKTTVDPVVMELISSIVQQELIQAAVFAPTVTDYSSLVGKGMDRLKLPKANSFTAEQKAAVTAMNAQALTIATDDLDLDMHWGVQSLVEDIAALQANIDVFGEYLKRMATSLAYQMDQKIYDCLKAVSASGPDHKIDWSNAPTDTMTKADFISARKLLRQANAPLEDGKLFCAINPKREAEILALSDFVDADKWFMGSADAKLNGVIGKVYGFQILVSNIVEDDAVVLYHSNHVGFARQQAPKYETLRDLAYLSDRISLSHLYGCKALQGGKLGVLIGTP